MLKQHKLSLAKGLIAALSQQVYQQRGELAVIGFRGSEASVLKAPGKLTGIDDQWIRNIQGGGATPISQGIKAAETLLLNFRWQYPSQAVDCWLLSDGRFRALPTAPRGAVSYTVIDFEAGHLRLARAKQLAGLWRAAYLHIGDYERDVLRVGEYAG